MLPSYFDNIFMQIRQKHVSGPNLAQNFVNFSLEPDPKSPARLTTLKAFTYSASDFPFFIGLTRGRNNRFRWRDLTILSGKDYQNWENGKNFSFTTTERCVIFGGTLDLPTTNSEWRATNCNENASFVCQQSIGGR